MSRRDEREVLRRLSERRSERGEAEPPADLLERLRAEIPATVRVHRDATGQESGRRPSPRQRWLIAASLAAMVGMGLFSLHVLKRGGEAEKAPAWASTATPPPAGRPAPPTPAAPPAPPAVTAPQASRELRYQLEVAPPAKPRERQRADSAGAPEGGRRSVPPEPAAPAAPAAAPPPQESAGGVVGGIGGVPGGFAGSAGATGSVAAEDRQGSPEPAAKSEARPMAKLAQPSRGENRAYLPARGGATAEGAPAPLAGDAPRWLLLFRPEGAALAPGARVEVAFDPAAVADSRRIGGGADRLYEVKLQPGAAAEATVATLQSVSPGASPRVLRTLRVADLTPAWEQASTGFRLTSLAAELEEVLAGTRPRSDLPELLRRARGLAAELPGEARAADLLRRIEQAGAP